MFAEELLPLLHSMMMAVVPRRTGNDELDLLAAFTVVYQCAATPEAYSLFAQQCESRSRLTGVGEEVAGMYQRLALLARWRAVHLERRG
jgi:hypothetical protein